MIYNNIINVILLLTAGVIFIASRRMDAFIIMLLAWCHVIVVSRREEPRVVVPAFSPSFLATTVVFSPIVAVEVEKVDEFIENNFIPFAKLTHIVDGRVIY